MSYVKIRTIATRVYSANAYVYYDETSRTCAVIDPGGDAERIIECLNELGLKVEHILLTHGHFDHIMAVRDIVKHTGAPVCAGADERPVLTDASMNLSNEVFGEDYVVNPDVLLDDGDVINVGQAGLRVISTPGHTTGGVCFYDETAGVLFSGDTLFRESVGRADLPGGNLTQLEQTIKQRLYTLPEATKVYPGHMGETTIGHERKRNPYVRA